MNVAEIQPARMCPAIEDFILMPVADLTTGVNPPRQCMCIVLVYSVNRYIFNTL